MRSHRAYHLRRPGIVIPAFALTISVLVACGSRSDNSANNDQDASVCSPACASGQACDPVTARCVPAIGAGGVCGALPDGGVVEGACGDGLTCGTVGPAGGVKRCAKSCSTTVAADCGQGQKCYGRASNEPGGYCGTSMAAGQVCDIAQLAFCKSDSTCIVPSSDTTAGQCFLLCDPSQPADCTDTANLCCPAGRACVALFSDNPSTGYCVIPVGSCPNHCNYAQLAFCGRDQVCMRVSNDVDWGYCYQTCDPQASNCSSPDECTQQPNNQYLCVHGKESCGDADCITCGI